MPPGDGGVQGRPAPLVLAVDFVLWRVQENRHRLQVPVIRGADERGARDAVIRVDVHPGGAQQRPQLIHLATEATFDARGDRLVRGQVEILVSAGVRQVLPAHRAEPAVLRVQGVQPVQGPRGICMPLGIPSFLPLPKPYQTKIDAHDLGCERHPGDHVHVH